MVETCSHLSEVLQKIRTTFVHLLLGPESGTLRSLFSLAFVRDAD
jgi:hypothetical protein